MLVVPQRSEERGNGAIAHMDRARLPDLARSLVSLLVPEALARWLAEEVSDKYCLEGKMNVPDESKLRAAADESDAVAKQLYEQVGTFATLFAGLEGELVNGLGLLLDDNDPTVGYIIAKNMTYSRTIDLFQELSKHRLKDKKPLEELAPLIRRLRDIGEKRNDIIHSAWLSPLGDNSKFLQQKARRSGGGAFEVDPFPKLSESTELASAVFDEKWPSISPRIIERDRSLYASRGHHGPSRSEGG